MGEINISNLTKRFGDVTAVDDFDIDIEDGEFLVLVGPSGCGKSTTLRCIAGLESPSEGNIYFDGDDVTYRVPQNRDVAMVFQDYALYPHMTVHDNMKFGLEEEPDYTDEERDARVEEVADLLDISELLDRKPTELSGGQQQRVALGRAIVRDPAVFLMDEPLSNLDAKLRATMRTELQQLQEDLGVTTVYVTHDQTGAMTMSDRMAVMDGGELQQVGEPLELYHEPANLFVAEFLGEPNMNHVAGEIDGERFVSEEFTYEFDADILDAVGDTGDVVFGVRPESIEIREEHASSPGPHEFEMTVDVVEPMGNEHVVHLDFGRERSMDDSLIGIADGMRRIEEGDTVTVHLPIDAVHVFDAETGEALHNRRVDFSEKSEDGTSTARV
ncbi:ABC transporter ATP-binding protein [Halarchaeum sp. P4]|uniref:ABC transporter ATP-binding protein n=1 Tax=Halarchaeum sp. P4 TaxID=3421639 RepID=UPI003EBA7D24